jgi:hypothetical protein
LSLITSACGHAHASRPRDTWGDERPVRGKHGVAANLMACSKGFTILVNEAASAEGSSVVQAPTTENLSAFKVSNATEQAIYTITLPGHPAYPMIVHRVFHSAGRKVTIEMDACPYGDKTASLALYKQFHDLDAKIQGVAAKPATTTAAHHGRHHSEAPQ